MKDKGPKLAVSLKSSSVEISVVSLDKIPKLLFSVKETLLYKEQLDPTTFANKSLESLRKLIKVNAVEIAKHLKGSKECEIIFHPPWFLPELISENEKQNVVSLKKFFVQKVKPPQQKDYVQIENKIINILLNGYQLTKLKDIESNDIEINLYRSFVSKESVESIKQSFKEDLKQIKRFSFSTSSMEILETLKTLFVNEDNFIFFNIGGEVTELGVVENDNFTYESTIPMGTHMFSRELDTFITERGNLSTLRFLADESTDEKLDAIKKDKIDKVKNVWADKVMEALKGKESQLPRKIFVVANSDSVDFFKMILKDCNDCETFEFFPVNASTFNGKVENLENSSNKNVEYLLSTYYLSIKD